MTNTRIAAHTATHCIDCNVKLTKKNNAFYVIECDRADLCFSCYDVTIIEDMDDDVECPAPVVASVTTGRTNRSHAACAHPRTPAGRAACRKVRAHVDAHPTCADEGSFELRKTW
jgi:hypothetical protein